MHQDFYLIVTEWEHHPKVIIVLAHLIALGIVLPSDNLLGAILATMAVALPIVILIFIPYLLGIIMVALFLSLLQAMKTALRHPNPASHASSKL